MFSPLSLSVFFFLFFFSFLPSRRTPQVTIFVGTLQLHLHEWKRFFFTVFDPVWPKPACACRTSPILKHAAKDRTSFVRMKEKKPGNADEDLNARANRKFPLHFPNFFFSSQSVSLGRSQGCLPFTNV